jgi:hypothetical protein
VILAVNCSKTSSSKENDDFLRLSRAGPVKGLVSHESGASHNSEDGHLITVEAPPRSSESFNRDSVQLAIGPVGGVRVSSWTSQNSNPHIFCLRLII